MPFGKSGHFSINPQQAKMHDGEPKEAGPEEKEGAPAPAEHAHMIEVHHPEGHMNPSPGKHHTVTHHADGQMSHHDHADMKAVHDHIDAHMEGSEPNDSAEEEQAEAPEPEYGKAKMADSGGY